MKLTTGRIDILYQKNQIENIHQLKFKSHNINQKLLDCKTLTRCSRMKSQPGKIDMFNLKNQIENTPPLKFKSLNTNPRLKDYKVQLRCFKKKTVTGKRNMLNWMINSNKEEFNQKI